MPTGYQLKITIKDSHPPIWRRVIVPEHITFYDLDDIIEELFGWTHSHLFAFDFYNGEVEFSGNPMDSEDMENNAEECIDEWMEEGCSFRYTYDFGDDWIHTIKVEKFVEYSERYPKVLKFKGPNMIEDCGGIWGFEEYQDEAEEFDMDQVNGLFRTWNFPVAKPLNLPKDSTEENGEKYSEMLEKMQDMENVFRNYLHKPVSLTDVFMCYRKEDLITIAKTHGFTRYQRFKKGELAEWLKNHLLETGYMQEFLLKAREDEVALFEEAMEENGICMSEELISSSLLLSSYGAFDCEHDFYTIPNDVQEKYKKVVTPEFKKRQEEQWNFVVWCNAVVYLYGVISVEKFTEIYNTYEKQDVSANEMVDKIMKLMETEEGYSLIDGYFMDEQLEEMGIYKHVLSVQGDLPYYLPKDRTKFLDYGKFDCQEPDNDTEFFIEYLQKTGHMGYENAMIMFYCVQEAVRMNVDDMKIMEILSHSGLKLNSYKARNKAMEMVKRFGDQVRKWDYRGHTAIEWNHLKKESQQGKEQFRKIVPFSSGKKVYPNDLCPCGSGKKYKHCCGK